MKKLKSLQWFSESEGVGAPDTVGNDTGAQAEPERKTAEEPLSFDDFLAHGGQAEFDRRVNKAIKTAVDNAHRKWQTLR